MQRIIGLDYLRLYISIGYLSVSLMDESWMHIRTL